MRVIGYDDLRAKGITYHRRHLDKLVRAGHFPRPVKLGEHKNAFVEDEIDAWLESRITARAAEMEAA
jgi:prophage regulatory protein